MEDGETAAASGMANGQGFGGVVADDDNDAMELQKAEDKDDERSRESYEK